MDWLTLHEALAIAEAAGVRDAPERIKRVISEAVLVRPGTMPVANPKSAALRVRVISQRASVGMDWLHSPQLDFEKSEILQRGYTIRTQEEFEHPRLLHPARIECWAADIRGLFPAEKPNAPKVGRPDEYDWDEAERIAWAALEERGDPTRPENQEAGWRSISDVARLLQENAAEGDRIPAFSVARSRAKVLLQRKQRSQQTA
ncbi:hypothetical protein CO683_14795 [Bradyrhizobium ottawaense]|uniref:hypothetical protein n=1 Tax=Bradyrhizobium ottawaense TaxID=931866 RepID=UPI000BE940FB|nr:hypothetical protein [Bradyrhizobium ottawaense]PDT69229.1 hypothetical protein CO683_14795 [Bradyrhizobium ottawaense]